MVKFRRLTAIACALLTFFLTPAFTGCSRYIITLVSDVVTVPQGEELSTDKSDYIRASEKMMEEMTLDLSAVNTEVTGDYTASVTYGDETRYFTIRVADMTAPVINLTGTEFFIEGSGEIKISDVVASVDDFSGCKYGFSDDITKADNDKIILESRYFDGVGDATLEVIAKDDCGNISVKEITVHVVNSQEEIPDNNDDNDDVGVVTDYREYMNHNSGALADSLDSYSSNALYFGVGTDRETATNRPKLNYYINLYPNLAVDFIQPQSKYVWLTFNETSERGNTAVILDILKEKQVSAVFFVTLNYAKSNPDLIKRMIDEGHVIGNFTANCVKVGDLSVNELTTELNALYNYLQDTYGYKMYLFRPPSGYYSERAIAVAESLGYRTVFWSYAYADWDLNNQPPVSEALANALSGAHGGAIYLFGGSSTTNRDMLADFIDGIRAKDLEFAVYQKI